MLNHQLDGQHFIKIKKTHQFDVFFLFDKIVVLIDFFLFQFNLNNRVKNKISQNPQKDQYGLFMTTYF